MLAKLGWNYADDARLALTYEHYKNDRDFNEKSSVGGPFIPAPMKLAMFTIQILASCLQGAISSMRWNKLKSIYRARRSKIGLPSNDAIMWLSANPPMCPAM